MRDECQALARVHARVSDAIAGYEEASRRGAAGTVRLASAMSDLHRRHQRGLKGMLASRGCEPSADGSFMALIHEGAIRLRDWVDDLDGDLSPRLRRTEERILGFYDEAIAALRDSAPERAALVVQRGELAAHLTEIERRAA